MFSKFNSNYIPLKPWLNKQQYNKLNSVIILFQSTLIIIKQSLPTKITNKIPGMSSKLTSMLNRSNGAESFVSPIWLAREKMLLKSTKS
jgi:hypothetical protein